MFAALLEFNARVIYTFDEPLYFFSKGLNLVGFVKRDTPVAVGGMSEEPDRHEHPVQKQYPKRNPQTKRANHGYGRRCIKKGHLQPDALRN